MQYKNHSTVLRLDLQNGEIHELPGAASEGNYRRAKFQLHTLYLYNSNAVLKRPEETTRQEREMNIHMMLEEIAKRNEQKEKRMAQLEQKAMEVGFTSSRQVQAWIAPPTAIPLVWSKVLTGLGIRDPVTFPKTVSDPEVASKLRLTSRGP